MDCKDCYKFGHCWACVLWFGCTREKPDNCFLCSREDCQKEKKDEQ